MNGDEVNKEVSDVVDLISSLNHKKMKVYNDEKVYLLDQKEIETIYSENGKIFLRSNNVLYTVKNRLYELETILDKKIFIRISNSEIVNFNEVKNIDLKTFGTMILNFKSGNKAYTSR